MEFFDWINKRIVYVITGGVIIGLIASANKGLEAKDGPRAFGVRLFGGGTMAGFVAYLLSDINMPKIVFGLVVWFVGWFSGQAGALLAHAGKDKLEDVIGKEKEADDTP